jgi:DUF971 family protein
MSAKTTPTEIGRSGEHDVKIRWEDGHESVYPARYLRLNCRCAVCVDEVSGAPLLNPDSVAEDVHPTSLELVGHYAIQPSFSDGHFTGIFSFEYLRSICPCPVCDPSGQ